jgi:hypothetical protein
MSQESQVERCEHQDDSNIHRQPFPESVSEEPEIYADYNGCHRHHVKHDSCLSAHFSPWFNRKSIMFFGHILPLKVPNFKLMGWMAPGRHLSAKMVFIEDHQRGSHP